MVQIQKSGDLNCLANTGETRFSKACVLLAPVMAEASMSWLFPRLTSTMELELSCNYCSSTSIVLPAEGWAVQHSLT